VTNASELNEESSEGVKISDKRRIDPQTGQLRDESAAEQNSGETGAETPDKVSELTADLQRITAEYANYRKRVDRDRELIRDMSTSVALEQLIPILDDISRAREHGDLTGTFSTVADALSTVTKRLGLVEFGKVDEDFDPSIHEALSTMEDESVQSQKVGTVAQVGYKVGERILRPARVIVKQPPAK
jgi:molecular chaperone GrpE